MIVTGASLLGQILTNRTSSGLLFAHAAVPAEPLPPDKTGSAPASAPVTMSLSTLDALFALHVSPRGTGGAGAPADIPTRMIAPSSGADAGSLRAVKTRTGGRTVVDPDLVRAIAAALDSRKSKGDGTGPTVMSQGAAGSLQTSVSRESSLRDALELAGRAQ
ncbi:hypothetical protein [Methylobacterium tarhaniae]|uniref:hypothetical protein n=1 Tax=Methylobacterium tarhaniae TaxID=1187852 RepID=UPI003CFC1923